MKTATIVAANTNVSTDEQKRLKRQLKDQAKKKRKREVDEASKPADVHPPSFSTVGEKEQEGETASPGAEAGAGTEASPVLPPLEATPKPAFPFKTDEADHAETPFEAYEDIDPVLKFLQHLVGKTSKTMKIYDPYYCGGAVKNHMAKLGFDNVHNQKEDFYARAERSAKGPGDFDVLMTNPPYSANHVERLFKYCAKTPDKPFLLLLPMYFYTEPFYKETIGSQSNLSNLFFICPGLGGRYGYTPPNWAGVDREDSAPSGIAPFPSFWYAT